MNDPWSILEPGDRFTITSYSGRKYEATFLKAGPDDAGLYVRLANKKLARFSPGRLIWTSLEKASAGEVLFPGDDVLVKTKNGEHVGKLAEPPAGKINLTTPTLKTVSIALEDVVPGSFRLLFPASDLRAGDELLVRSTSGREYRGHAIAVLRERITARLASGEQVAIRVEHLDLRSLHVLIPLDLPAVPLGGGS